MIGNPTVGLVQQIEKAQIANEAKLAKQVERPTFELDTEAQLQWRHFQLFCQTRGVRFQGAHPATVASFVFSENSYGVPPDRIMSGLEAIETSHDNAGLPNPVATSIVRTAVGKVLRLEAPRSWPARDRPKFYTLPVEVQAVVLRRSQQDTKAVRQAQNGASELRHELKQLENEIAQLRANKEGTENG
jgi:hypothetical protein